MENTLPTAADAGLAAIPAEPVHSAPAASEPEIDPGELLDLAIAQEASDIHFGAGSQIGLRIHGHIQFVESAGIISPAQAERFIMALLPGEAEKKKFIEQRELDFSFKHVDGTSFRANAFYRRGAMSIVMRRIASKVPSMQQLGLPPACMRFTQAKQGLVLVTGPTGSGKSTSLCAILEEINANRVEHIVTIEDPIEYLFKNNQSIFSQRELNYDTHSFSAALRGAMRQDPDVIMVGELRDVETISAALTLAETGHLVFSTLHTNSAAQTINRIVNVFPMDQRPAVLTRLADSLLGVLSQRLLPKIGGGRVAMHELMITTSGIRNAIRQGDLPMIDNAIATGADTGMMTMRQSAQRLVTAGLVTQADIEPYFAND